MKSNLRRISELREEDFLEYPVWTWAEEEDESLVEPVSDYTPLPEDHDALFIAARLTFANGRFFNGVVFVGCDNQKVYLIEVFSGMNTFDLPLKDRVEFTKVAQRLGETILLPTEQILPIYFRD